MMVDAVRVACALRRSVATLRGVRFVGVAAAVAGAAVSSFAFAAAPGAQAPAARKAKSASKAPRWAPRLPRGYAESIKRSHQPAPGARPEVDERGRAMLVLAPLNGTERAVLKAASDDGGFDAEALERASHVLRDPRTGLEHPVEPALLDVVYRAQRSFGASEIRVVSGYRAPTGRGRSNHGRGRAIDVIVPGAKDADVASWARGLGFTGVGLYPTSGFCHLDVRSQSYSWVDRSGPGQRNREVAVSGGLASQADDAARREGRRAVLPYAIPSPGVVAAWSADAGTRPASDDDGDEEDD